MGPGQEQNVNGGEVASEASLTSASRAPDFSPGVGVGGNRTQKRPTSRHVHERKSDTLSLRMLLTYRERF